MKLTKAVLLLCTLFCIELKAADEVPGRTLRGAVITSDGTVVPEFTVIIRPAGTRPQLVRRKHFKDGEFMIDGLVLDRYQIQVTSPMYISVQLDVDFAAETKPRDYCIFLLHKYRNEPRFANPQAYTVSLKTLQQKVPDAARAAYQRGVDFHREGRLGEAIMAYGEALRLYPQYVQALSDVGTIYTLFNRPDSALAFLRRAQQVDHENSIVRLNIAIALLAKREYGAAWKVLEEALRNDTQKSLPLYFMASVQYAQKKYDEAERILRQAIEEDPRLLEAWVMLVNVAIERNNPATAREGLVHLREAMKDRMFSRFVDEQLAVLAND
jgi:tetratricopeptide (TPR) repeat protein